MDDLRICSIENCGKPRKGGRIWCSMHCERDRKGVPMERPTGTPYGDLVRFFEASLTRNTDECIIWPYGTDGHGYAKFSSGQKSHGTTKVYRAVCAIKNGPPPTPKHQAAHSCGKGSSGCINHRHLSWKTPLENNRDKFAHGTAYVAKKLTETEVLEIRRLRGLGALQADLAKSYGVNQPTISNILNRKIWGWLV